MDFDSGTSFVPRSHERHESLEKKKASDRFRSIISQFAGHRTGGPSLPNCFMSWIDFRIFQESNLQENLRWLTSWLSIETIKRLWEGMTELYHCRHDEKHVPTDGRWSSSVLRVDAGWNREDLRGDCTGAFPKLPGSWWFHFRPSQRKQKKHTK